ncbi:HisJ ABC-type amino acid transport/signal transduction systems, periplasmic component/domain [Rhabdaerophilaceae bacterium]
MSLLKSLGKAGKSLGKAGAIALFAFGLLAPIASAQTAPNSVIEEAKKRGKLQVGMASFIPWAMRDNKGNWVGFEIDVATKVAKDLGVELELFPTAWDAIIPTLLAGKFDTIIGGLSITPVRAEQVAFTNAYSTSGQGIAASKKLAEKLKYPEDYNSAAVTLVCRRGAAPCKTATDLFPKATVRQFDDDVIAFQEVMNGNAHAVITSEPKPTFFVLDNPDKLFLPAKQNVTTSTEGFALRKGDAASIAYFNDWIAKNETFLKERHTYWFKSRAWADQVPKS